MKISLFRQIFTAKESRSSEEPAPSWPHCGTLHELVQKNLPGGVWKHFPHLTAEDSEAQKERHDGTRSGLFWVPPRGRVCTQLFTWSGLDKQTESAVPLDHAASSGSWETGITKKPGAISGHMLVVRTAQQAAEVQLQLQTSAQDICLWSTALWLGKRPWKQEHTQLICNSPQSSGLSQLCTSPWSRWGRAESLPQNHHPTQGAPQLWRG